MFKVRRSGVLERNAVHRLIQVNVFGADGKQEVWRKHEESDCVSEIWWRKYARVGRFTASSIGNFHSIEGIMTVASILSIYNKIYTRAQRKWDYVSRQRS